MSNLKALVAVAVAVAFLGSAGTLGAAETKTKNPPAKAKPGARAPRGEYGMPKVCADKLNLTSDQKNKLKAINLKYVAEMKKLRDANLSQSARQAKMKELQNKRQAEVKAVLSDAQEAKLKACIEEQRKAMAGKNKGKARGGAKKGAGAATKP